MANYFYLAGSVMFFIGTLINTVIGGSMRDNIKWLKNECKKLELPLPAHPYGFRDSQLLECLSKSEHDKFWRWMYGQTMMMDEGEPIAYTEDVLRGVRLIRYGTPTYWD